MNAFLLNVTSPDGTVFSDSAVKLSVRGVEGDLAVMAGHTPFITYLVPCTVKIELEDGKTLQGSVKSGLLTVSKEKVILLTGEISLKKS